MRMQNKQLNINNNFNDFDQINTILDKFHQEKYRFPLNL